MSLLPGARLGPYSVTAPLGAGGMGRFLTLKHLAPAPGDGKRLIWMQNWPAAVKK